MSMLKKIVSFTMVLAMLLTMCAFSITAKAEVAVNEYDYLVKEKLDTLGVIDTVDDSSLAETVLRKDVIEILSQYLFIAGGEIEGNTTPFLDVSVFDENIGLYRSLYKMGYISGDENAKFRPEDALTYNEAIKLVVSAMGYAPFAHRNGGYPAGYLYTANKYGLLAALRGAGNEPIPYCDLYRLIEASLYADAVSWRFGVGEDDSSFSLDDTRTVLEELRGIKILTGVVTGSENTRISNSASYKIDRNQIEIEHVIYDTPEKEYAEFLGRRVDAYAKKAPSGKYEIIYLEKNVSNNEFELSAEDILVSKTTDTKIVYEDKNLKERYLNLKTGVDVIKNGKRFSYSSIKAVMPVTGKIVGVDNNGDMKADVLFIYEYINIVVSSVSKTSYVISGEYGETPLDVDPYDNEVRYFNANGEAISINDIFAGDVLSYMKTSGSKDYEIVTVYKNDASVQGKVLEIADDKYLIEDKYYKIANSLKTHIQNNPKLDINIGDSATYYLDLGGNIAHYTLDTKAAGEYGVLAAVSADDSDMENVIKVKLYNQKAEWLEATLSDTVRVNGKRYNILKNKSDFNSVANMLKSKDNALGHALLYTLGSGNLITAIDIADRQPGDPGELHLVGDGRAFTSRGGMIVFGRDMDKVVDGTNRGNKSPWKQVEAKSNVIIFKTPSIDELDESTSQFVDTYEELLNDTESWAVEKSLKNPAEYNVNSAGTAIKSFAVYNLNPTGVENATCVVLRTGKISVPIINSSSYYVITNLTTAVDDEGNVGTKVYYSKNGAEASSFIKQTDISYMQAAPSGQASSSIGGAKEEKKTLAQLNLTVGDVVQLGIDGNGYISSVNRVYRANNADQTQALINADINSKFNTTSNGNYSGIVLGYVNSVDTTNKVIAVDSIEGSSYGRTDHFNDPAVVVMNAATDITIYTKGKDKTENGSLADIMKNDVVLLRSAGGFNVTSSQIVVIR